MTKQKPLPRAETIAAAFGVAADPTFGAVAPPLYFSSTYAFRNYREPGTYDYGRAGNPTRDLLAEALARLEGGAGGVITSSGMAATDLLLGRLRPEDLIVAPHDCYGGVSRLLKARAAAGQFRVSFINQTDDRALVRELERGVALLFVETPSNPLMRIVDIAHLTRHAHERGAKVVVDNTFLSPALQTPIAFGADYVLHSTTKFINGHSDVIGGAVIAADVAEAQNLKAWINTTGSAGAPFDSWLTLRGLRTLFARVERQQRNAEAVAAFLASHPAVSAVHYPGLLTHAGHDIALRQQRGFGAMLSFELQGDEDTVRRFLSQLRVFTLAESLGGIESLIAHPMTMTHADMGAEGWRMAGINSQLLRLSVGLEHVEDLILDLQAALSSLAA